MAKSHHPPRHCFSSVDFDDAAAIAHAHFTEGESYDYRFDNDRTGFDEFRSNANGQWFNAHLRPSRTPFTRTN
jgi:hypothetical protein